ncbi:MAG TPA: ABC transporter substrate-binding protein [Stellaceae bacterium]|nr:ABC transporter substrate-binding protein [Stellaceae bacterium]
MRRVFSLLAVVCLAALMLAPQARARPDCGENTGQKAIGKPIPVGAITTMSGIATFKEVDQAVKAYFDCVNANGGVHGRPITYYDEDDQARLDIATQAAKKLVGDQGVYIMVGSTSIIECIANSQYYVKENIVEIGEGIPPQCYQSRNIAEINAGPRQSGIGGADYARRRLGIKSLVCTIPRVPGSDYSCGGIEEWGKKYGVKVTSIYSDPVSPDYSSLVLQILATGADAVMFYATDNIGVQILAAAEQQDGAAKMKWTAPTSLFTTRFPAAIDDKYWNDRIYVNAELAPLGEAGKDNRNWIAVMDAYGGNALRDSFSQAGYIAARIAVRAMLTIKNPADINRNTVTAAVKNMPPYPTDILCQPWYWGGPDATEHNANHVTRMVTVHNGKWKELEGCVNDADPGLANIEALEKKLGIKIDDQVPLASQASK